MQIYVVCRYSVVAVALAGSIQHNSKQKTPLLRACLFRKTVSSVPGFLTLHLFVKERCVNLSKCVRRHDKVRRPCFPCCAFPLFSVLSMFSLRSGVLFVGLSVYHDVLSHNSPTSTTNVTDVKAVGRKIIVQLHTHRHSSFAPELTH